MTAEVRLGTSGYSFPHWNGRVYPRGVTKDGLLTHYATLFDTVELNTTYYGIPAPAVLARMRDQVPDDFLFVVKAYGGITHEAGVNEDVCRQFRDALAPLREAGRLGAVLLQFPYAFQPGSDSEDKLKRLKEQLSPDPLVVEFRHRDWLARPRLALVRQLEMGWCSVDEPQLGRLMPPVSVATSRTGYVRFHGRNKESWYGRDRDQRYNYLYRERELLSWLGGIAQLAAACDRLFVFMNNCHQGHAAKNAQQVEQLLQQFGVLQPSS